jgi:hypothetical protein
MDQELRAAFATPHHDALFVVLWSVSERTSDGLTMTNERSQRSFGPFFLMARNPIRHPIKDFEY